MEQAFGGIRVVDFSEGMAGPLATMVMADNGAEVIKVEPPGGDWSRQSPGFLMWNRGKKSVVLDLDSEEGREQARSLALTADVVLESFRATRAEHFGLDYDSLSRDRPDLVYCSITGFGTARGYDHLEPRGEIVAAKSGRLNNNDKMSGALFSGRPVFLTSPFGAFGAAGLAVQGISAALLARARTGVGEKVHTSMLDGTSVTTMRLAFQRQGNKIAPAQARSALVIRGILLTFMTARCKDGRFLQMCARTDQHFRNWLRALGLDDALKEERYAKAPLGFKNDADINELEQRISDRMVLKTQAEWMEIFSTEWDVGCDPFLTPAEFLQHPQMLANGRIVTLDDPVYGEVIQIGPIAVFSDTPSKIIESAPVLGQHQHDLPGLLARRLKGHGSPPQRERPRTAAAAVGRMPLEGITILELATFLATPLSATLLASMGARVIKVEPLDGDPYRRAGTEAVHLLQGKESIALDLKSEQGQEVFRRLVRTADALVHNYRPGVPERLGVDYESLRKTNPRLVYLYGASYGSKGPQSGRPAFHSTPHALCGGGILQAGVGNPPVDDSYPDPVAAVGAAMALAMGLLAREKTGRGQYVETTMLASTGYVHSERLTHYGGMPQLPSLDSGQFGFHALNRLYDTGKGWLILSVLSEDEWQRLATSLGHAEWRDDPRFVDRAARMENDAELVAALQQVFAGQDAEALEKKLSAAGAPASAVGASFQEFIVSNDMVHGDEHPAFGTYWRLKSRVRFSGSPEREGRPCGVGEHSVRLLQELGYDQNQIRILLDKRAVAAFSG